MPTIGPKTKSVGTGTMLDVAKSVLAGLDRYKRQKPPPKPVDVPPDVEMCRLMAKRRADGRMTNDERATLKLFVAWRSTVFAIEMANASNLALLLSVCRFIEQEAARKKAEATGEDQGPVLLTEKSKGLRKFIHDEFGRWPGELITDKAIREDSEELVREKILNKNLRYGEMVS